MSRTVVPDGKKIASLREDRGWSQQELADNFGLSLRTIQSLERSKPCLRCTLLQLAKSPKPLVADFKEVVTGYGHATPADLRKISGVRITIQVVIDESFKDLDQTELVAYIKGLAELVNANGRIEVNSVKDGSVTLEVEMDLPDILRLLRQLAMGNAEPFGILRIIPPEGVRLLKYDSQGNVVPDVADVESEFYAKRP